MSATALPAYPGSHIEHVQTLGAGEGLTVAACSSRVLFADDDYASARPTGLCTDAYGAAQRKSSLSRNPLPSPPPDRGRLYTPVVDQDGLCSVPLSNECFCRE